MIHDESWKTHFGQKYASKAQPEEKEKLLVPSSRSLPLNLESGIDMHGNVDYLITRCIRLLAPSRNMNDLEAQGAANHIGMCRTAIMINFCRCEASQVGSLILYPFWTFVLQSLFARLKGAVSEMLRGDVSPPEKGSKPCRIV